ncbi:MAG TPA: response regulator [Anaerolineae bacterium]
MSDGIDPAATQAAAPTEPPDKRPVALIIEGDPAFSDALALCLRQQGYEPVQPHRGQDARAAARALRPALIALDLFLPDVDGWSVLHQLKSDPHTRRVPVLILSDATQAGPEGFGPTAYHHKPISRARLVETITQLMPSVDRPPRILIVDDDPFLVEIVSSMLPPPKYQVHTAASAEQAVHLLRAELPDLVLLDLVMPQVSGLEFLESLRADSRTRHLPVLVLTAKHLSPQEQDELNQGAQIVLTKGSFQTDRLAEKVHYLKRVSALTGAGYAEAPHVEPSGVGVDVTEFKEDFRREARECLIALRTGIEPNAPAGNEQALDGARRAMHTLKGMAATMGYSPLSELARQAENVLSQMVNAEGQPDAARLASLRALSDQMDSLIASF